MDQIKTLTFKTQKGSYAFEIMDETARNGIPTKTSQLTNDSSYVTADQIKEELSLAASDDGAGNVTLTAVFQKKLAIVVDTDTRNFTAAQWAYYGGIGHEENWVRAKNYASFEIGDTAILYGTVSDKGGIDCTLIGKVLSTSSSGVRLRTTKFVEGKRVTPEEL